MQELINRLTTKAGITTEQAANVLETIKEFVKEKFPMMGGAVDNLLAGDTQTATTAAAAAAAASPSFLDKISDMIPGETGEKIESFAKQAADKAGDAYDDVKGKISGMFGDDKK